MARGALGLNALRVGRFDTARVHLERAFKRDPYHVWIKNTLDLLDTFGEYRETRTNRFHLIVHGREAALLSPYLLELLDEGYQKLAARYGYEPPTPIRLEVYRSHGDFSVRTVGLPGLGALGVSFGSVLAMHSPSARQVGEYNWGGAAGTKFWIDPKEDLIGIYMVQILPHTGLRFGDFFKILAYQSIVE